MRKHVNTIWGPTKLVFCNPDVSEPQNSCDSEINIEMAVHSTSSVSYLRELRAVFPGWNILKSATIISTMQNADIDLVGIGSQLESEKDTLLEKFVAVAKKICKLIEEAGYCADFIDPCSGLPGLCLDGNTVFNEVQSAQILLGYRMMNVGCCKVILHPEWGSAVYPASIVTLAPPELVIEKLEQFSKEYSS